MKKIKLLITGGNGYIAQALFDFLNENHLYDVFLTGRKEHANICDVTDLTNLISVEKQISKIMPDYCIHCAGSSSVQKSIQNPINDFENNVITTRNLLESLRIFSPKTKFIYLSSAAVYGDSLVSPLKETDKLNPISPYGYSKLCAELIINQYSKIYDMNSAILRIFSVYGPNMKKQVVHDIFEKFLDTTSNVVELFGTGEEKRDFIYIDELLEIIDLIIRENASGTFNVASGDSTCIKYLAENIKNEIKSSKVIKYSGRARKGDPLKWDVDISRLQRLGYIPKINIDEGIKLYYEWIKQQK